MIAASRQNHLPAVTLAITRLLADSKKPGESARLWEMMIMDFWIPARRSGDWTGIAAVHRVADDSRLVQEFSFAGDVLT